MIGGVDTIQIGESPAMPGQSLSHSHSATPTLVPTGTCSDHPAILLDRPTLLIGARDGCDLQLAFSALSDVHTLVVSAAEGVYVRNLTSPDALRVNGQPVREQLLTDGDELQMGEFTCRFSANSAALNMPEPLPPWAFEFNNNPIPPVRGRTVLIGTAPYCDMQVTSQAVAPCHAVLFAADGKWHITDLATADGSFVNGKPVRCADLEAGDVLRIGFCQVRVLSPDQPEQPAPAKPQLAEPAQHFFSTINDCDAYLGGMPVALPEIAPPTNFGRVGVSFGDKTLRPQPPAPTPVGPAANKAEHEEFVPVNTHKATVADVPESPQQNEIPPMTTPLHAFPVVPMRRANKLRPAAQAFEESLPEDIGEQPLSINDAPFGGVPLGGTDGASDFEAAAMAESFGPEGESFANDEFWDRTDDEINLPARPAELTPYIPSGNGKTMHASPEGNGDHLPVPRAPVLVPVAMPAIPPPVGGYPAPQRRPVNRNRKTGILASAMAGVMLAGSTAMWLAIPTRTTVDGRLTFVNTPAQGTNEWKDFETQQRQRLADPALASAAIAILKNDHPLTDPGFLSGDPAALKAMLSSARFDENGIVIRYSGTDSTRDIQRLSALLKAQYDNDADLLTNVASISTELDGWDPKIALRKQEVDTLQRRMDQVAKVASSAEGLPEKLPALQAAALEAGQAFAAAERAVESDQAKLDELNQSLAGGGVEYSAVPATQPAATQPAGAVAGAPASRPTTNPDLAELPTTQPSTKDLRLIDLWQQIDDMSAQISALKNNDAAASLEKNIKARADAQKKLDASMAAAAAILRTHPDLRISFTSASEMQNRIGGLIDQLTAIRRVEKQWTDMRSLIEQTSRRRQRIIDGSDARLRELQTKLDVAEAALAVFEQQEFAATTQPSTQPTAQASMESSTQPAQATDLPTTEPSAPQPRVLVDQIEAAMSTRTRQLLVEDTAKLRDLVARLIEDAATVLRNQKQSVLDTLATLQAGVNAIDVPGDLSPDDKAVLSGLTQAVRDLMQSQSDAVDALGQNDAGDATVASLEQQLSELKDRAEARRRILTAVPATDSAREQLMSLRDRTQAQLAQDKAAMETARVQFSERAMANAQTAVTVATARKAQADLAALTADHDSKQSDMNAMLRSRDDLAQRLKSTVTLKRPAEADILIVSDNSMSKLAYVAAADALIGGAFGMLIYAARKPKPADAK